MPGLRELVLVALVVVALYGRTQRVRSNRFLTSLGRLVRPTRPRHTDPAVFRWVVDRWMLVVALLAGAGVVAWVATSLRVVQPWMNR